MDSKAYKTIHKYNMLSQNDKVVVGFSGGADSCALLHFLVSLREKMNITVFACHINHMLRGEEADRDEEFVREFCRLTGVELYVLHKDVNAESRNRKISTEQCGREIRYKFFQDTAEKLNAKIATAHTASDNAETVLFNLTRGSGASGLCGIPPVRDNIIRPLIECTRKEIETYCLQNSIAYVTDSTNLTDEYTRNQIRLNVIPQLKAVNPSFENSVSGLTERMRENVDFVRQCAFQAIEQAKTEKGFKTDVLLKLHSAVFAETVRILCGNLDVIPEAKHIELIKKIVYNSGAVEIRENVFAVSKQGFFRVIRLSENQTYQSTAFEGQDTVIIGDKKILIGQINISDFHNRKKIDKFLFNNSADYDTIPLSCIFRTRQSGDIFTLYGRNVTKSVKKLFNELKIPQEERDRKIILAAGCEVIWIEGVGVSEKFRVNPQTKTVLTLKVEE